MFSREPLCQLLFMFIDAICQFCIVVLFRFFFSFSGLFGLFCKILLCVPTVAGQSVVMLARL